MPAPSPCHVFGPGSPHSLFGFFVVVLPMVLGRGTAGTKEGLRRRRVLPLTHPRARSQSTNPPHERARADRRCPGAGRPPIAVDPRQGKAPEPGRARLPGLRAPPTPGKRSTHRRASQATHATALRRRVGRPASTRRRLRLGGWPLASWPCRRPGPHRPRPGLHLLGVGVADRRWPCGAGHRPRTSARRHPKPPAARHPRPGSPAATPDRSQRQPGGRPIPADQYGSPSSRRQASTRSAVVGRQSSKTPPSMTMPGPRKDGQSTRSRSASPRSCGVDRWCSRRSSSRTVSWTSALKRMASGASCSASSKVLTAAASMRCCA
jgi:hypothetical protein